MRAWCVVVALVFGMQFAHAEGGDTAGEPWKAGVSIESQDRANALLSEATGLFAQQAYADALTAYQAALAIWDSPAIRWAEAVVLIRLDRIVDAADSIDRALRFGAAPFTAEVYDQVVAQQKLVAGNVGKVEASCTEAGAQVRLDGQAWFQCPGTQTRRVLVGEHVLYAELPHFVARSQRVAVGADAVAHADIELVPVAQAFEERRRFRPWLPWTILGTGVGLVAAGFVLKLSGQEKIQQYDRAVASRCAVMGCSIEELADLRPLVDSGRFRNNLGLVGMSLGGAAVIGGFVMLVLNRPTPRLRAEFRPASGGAAASATWTW